MPPKSEHFWWIIALAMLLVWLAVLLASGCVAAGKTQQAGLGNEATETRSGDQKGPEVSGSGNWIQSINLSMAAGEGGRLLAFVAFYLLVVRRLDRKRREDRATCLIRKELRALPSNGATHDRATP